MPAGKIYSPAFESKSARPRRKRRQKPVFTPKQAAAVKAIATKQDNLRIEKKYLDTELNYNITNDFSITNTRILSFLAQGDSVNERIGDSVSPFSLYVKYELRVPDNDNRIRLVFWTMAEDSTITTPSMSRILEHANAANIDRDIYSPYVLQSKDVTFRILKDINYTMSSGTNTQFLSDEMYFDLTKFKNVDFSPGVANGRNHVYLSFVSDSAITPPTLKGWARFRYTDD